MIPATARANQVDFLAAMGLPPAANDGQRRPRPPAPPAMPLLVDCPNGIPHRCHVAGAWHAVPAEVAGSPRRLRAWAEALAAGVTPPATVTGDTHAS